MYLMNWTSNLQMSDGKPNCDLICNTIFLIDIAFYISKRLVVAYRGRGGHRPNAYAAAHHYKCIVAILYNKKGK